MTTVLLIIQLMISIVLIGLILIQRSEGGALGIGGGGGGGGMMSGRSSANAVTKATTILGTLFIVNCLALSVFFAIENPAETATSGDNTETGLIETLDSSNDTTPLADETVGTDLLDSADETSPDPDALLDGETPESDTAPETETDADQPQ